MSEVLAELKPIAAYDEFRAQLAELRESNSKAVFDYEDPQGNKDARSHVFQLRKTRTAIDKARKQEKESSLNYGRQVDAEAKDIMAEVELMIDVHSAPLKAIEAKEAARKQEIESKYDLIISLGLVGINDSIAAIKVSIEKLAELTPDDSFDEFMAEATREHKKSSEALNAALESAVKAEAEKAELQKLRDEQAERDQLERDKRIAEDAVEDAVKAAEQKAENDRLDAERKLEGARIAAKESQDRAEREKQEAIMREEAAKRSAVEAEQRHAEELIRVAKEAEAKAIRDTEAAAEVERLANEKRESNKRHKAKINNESVACLVENGIDKKLAKEIIKLIAKKEIANVSISY